MKKVLIGCVAVLAMAGAVSAQRVEYKWRGFYSTVDYSFGMNLNRGTDTVNAHLLSFVSGFQFRKEAAVGAGVMYVADPTGAFTQLPVFAELRSHYTRDRFCPYSVLQAGYSLPVGAKSETGKIPTGGLYFGLGGGVRYTVDRSFAVALHVDYKLLQSSNYKRFAADGTPLIDDAAVLHMLSAGVTLYF